jgi:HTH-type transcriptional regulator / antitoxin HigA
MSQYISSHLNLAQAWNGFSEATGAMIRRAKNTSDYDQLNFLMDQLTDEIQNSGQTVDESPYAPLFDLLAQYIAAWEAENDDLSSDQPQDDPANVVTGAELLAELLERHGLRQRDLSEIAPQSTISKILSGERQINARIAKALGQRFGLGAEAFL